MGVLKVAQEHDTNECTTKTMSDHDSSHTFSVTRVGTM